MFSIMIAENPFGLNKMNSIQQILQNGMNPIHASNLEECDDPDACNYDPTAVSDDGCIYMRENECDCEGNMYDCSGVCGGADTESCVIMNPETLGVYGNSDCSGEFYTNIEGICLDGDGSLLISEEICTNNNGIWMYFDTCYTFDFYTYSAVEIDFDNIDECLCGEGGIWQENTDDNIPSDGECIEGEEYWAFWFSSEGLDEFTNNGEIDLTFMLPNLYFFEDGTFGESDMDVDCNFINPPNQEDCENANGDFDDNSDCNWNSNSSQEVCEYAGGTWHEEEEDCSYSTTQEDCENAGGIWAFIWDNEEICYFNETSEEDCENAGGYWFIDWYGDEYCIWSSDLGDSQNWCEETNGEWNININCNFGNDLNQGNCELAGGIYFDSGVHTIGDFSINENYIILNFYYDEGPNDGGELSGEIISNDDDTQLILEFQEDEVCGNYIFSNDNPNAFSDLEISDLNIPQDYSFDQISPNPFNPTTNIEFSLNKIADVEISIFNILGESVQDIELETMNIGQHAVQWNASELPSGVYFVQLNVIENGKLASAQVQKALLIK